MSEGKTRERASRLAAMASELRFAEPILVMRPAMPPLAEYTRLLEGVWQRRWLTNDGALHRELEARLAQHLRVEHLSLFNNGMTALLVMLQALGISDGEVITTPFTFPATTHAIHWNKLRPVFCDIEDQTFNIDPTRIEQLVGPETRAILGVHVYGNPCAVDAIQEIADRHDLLVLYDAAHAFGVEVNGRPLPDYGDMSMLSFHATKVFSTVEGGALIGRTDAIRRRVNSLKNFGLAEEETIIGPGLNGKLNELQAAFGLLALERIEEETAKRRELALSYRRHLRGIRGLRVLEDIEGVRHNYAYFPIIIDADEAGIDRDEVHLALREFNVMARKYFNPLVSRAPAYAALPSADPARLPVAERAASSVLCLPIYGDLDPRAPEVIGRILRALFEVLP